MSNLINIVFLFDVDNTLIDDDRVQVDLKEHLEQTYGIAGSRVREVDSGK